MGRVKDTSWLMGPMPKTRTPQPEARLWWGVVRQAARDLRYGNRSTAVDALEYLIGSGCYMLSVLSICDASVAATEVMRVLRRRNRYHEEPIALPTTAKG